jgi:MHS family proline/betaine transporter-like MFS transporter
MNASAAVGERPQMTRAPGASVEKAGEGGLQRATARRAVIAASVGNAFEWYDFTVYALFAIYIAKAFFPGGGSTVELVKAFLAFGLGFVVRPLGALLLGIYGDRAGRKAVLTATIALMTLGVGVIAFCPGYAAIGVGAPILLLVGRVLQGFSAGGEYGGAAAMLVEHAPANRKGEFGAWLQATMAASNIMGALVAFTVTSVLTRAQLETFGWRLPFAFGLLIAPIGMWIRSTVAETPEFEASRRTAPDSRPFATLLTQYPMAVLRAWTLCVLLTVSSYSLVIFMPTYMQTAFHYAPRDAFAAMLVGNVLMVAACVVSGRLSDRLGRRTVLIAAALWLAILVLPMLWLMQAAHALPMLMLAQSVLCVGAGAFTGTAPTAVAEMFPTRVRATGVSVSYNLAVTIFSGFAPAVLSWLTGQGLAFAPGWYELIAAAIAAPALIGLKRLAGPSPAAVEAIASGA